MELSQEIIEELIKQKEMENLLMENMQMEADNAKYLACQLLNYGEEIMSILTAEYKIEVTRI